jgi:hypothetical protein
MEATTKAVYQLLRPLPRYDYTVPRSELPASGIYIFYERGEVVDLDGQLTDRVVQIGTHNADGNFRGRIRMHYGNIKSLGGDKNSSVFRRHVGAALMRKANPLDERLGGWLKHMGPSTPVIEQMVSQYLRAC